MYICVLHDFLINSNRAIIYMLYEIILFCGLDAVSRNVIWQTRQCTRTPGSNKPFRIETIVCRNVCGMRPM